MDGKRKSTENKRNLEFRYYEMPADTYVMALLGDRWILQYGEEAVHFHNYLEIGYCYYGKGEMILGDKRCPYRGEMFTVIPQNIPHKTCGKPGQYCRWEYLFVDVNGFLQKIYRDRPFQVQRLVKHIENHYFISSFEQNPALERLIRCILEEMRGQKEFYKESVRGYLLALLIELSRAAGEPEKEQAEEPGEERIAQILNYISMRYASEIRVSELADMCHISETHFRRIFEKITNTTPVEYINMIRIQNACALLTETSDSIESIRERVGFTTASTFNRNFRKFVKMSPGKWREKGDGHLADYQISIYKGW